MGLFAKGTVVLVPYPFSDLSSSKLRPALVVAEVSNGDHVLCQITTKPYGDKQLVLIDPKTNSNSGLRLLSYARTEKLFSGHESIIVDRIGELERATVTEIIESIISILRK